MRRRVWLLVVGMLTFAVPCRASRPPVERKPLNFRDLRLIQLYDESLLAADAQKFKSFFDNADRVHLSLSFSPTRKIGVALSAPKNWGESRAVDAVVAVVRGLGCETSVINTTTHENNVLASALTGETSQRSGLQFHADVNLPGVFKALQAAGVSKVEVRLRIRFGRSVSTTPSGLEWTQGAIGSRPLLAAVGDPSVRTKMMRLTFGYDHNAARRLWFMLFALLLAPLAVMAGARVWVMKRVGDDAAYQTYTRLGRAVLLWSFVVWSFAWIRSGALDVLLLPLATASRGVRLVAILLVLVSAPLVVAVGTSALSFQVEQKFRSVLYNRWAFVLRMVLPLCFVLLPFIIVFVALTVAPEPTTRLLFGSEGKSGLLGSPITLVLLFGGIATLLGRIAMVRGMKPRPLEQGELVASILGLCRKADVDISQVLIAHTERDRVANAMVTSGRIVMLTDYLVRRFTREEVDAVVAHELAHLRLRHLNKQVIAHVAGLALWLALAQGLRSLLPPGWWNDAVIWTFFIVPPLVHHFVSRRHELQADAEAVAITGDPQTYVRMLKKLAAANRRPLRSRLDELTGTHPSAARRIRAIATRYGLSDAQVQALIAEADEPLKVASESPETTSGYTLPEEGKESGDILFTPQARMRIGCWVGLLGVAPFFLCLVFAMVLMKLYAPSGRGALAAAFVIGGFVLGTAAALLANRYITFLASRRLRPKVQAKVEAAYGVNLQAAPHVGVSPGNGVRSYSGDTSWDVGFLLLEMGRMRYFGDRATFELRPEQIKGSEIRTHSHLLAGSFPHLFVTWQETADAAPQTFSLEARDARSLSDLRRLTQALQQKIEAWRQDTSTVSLSGSELGLPPRPDDIVGAPLPPASQAGCVLALVALILAFGIRAGGLYLAVRIFGKDNLNNPLIRFGSIFAAIILFNIALAKLQERAKRKQAGQQSAMKEDDGKT